MKNIKEFKNQHQLFEYFNRFVVNTRPIGTGSEGDVYLARNNEIIKLMFEGFDHKMYDSNSTIIMEDDLKLDSFIFPKELFIIDDRIVGYRSRYFKGNIFDLDLTINKININALINARYKFIEDTSVITDYGYFLFELPRNLLFNNKQLVAIDTLDYKKNNEVTLDENINSIDYSILLELSDIGLPVDVHGSFEKEIEKVKK